MSKSAKLSSYPVIKREKTYYKAKQGFKKSVNQQFISDDNRDQLPIICIKNGLIQ